MCGVHQEKRWALGCGFDFGAWTPRQRDRNASQCWGSSTRPLPRTSPSLCKALLSLIATLSCSVGQSRPPPTSSYVRQRIRSMPDRDMWLLRQASRWAECRRHLSPIAPSPCCRERPAPPNSTAGNSPACIPNTLSRPPACRHSPSTICLPKDCLSQTVGLRQAPHLAVPKANSA